MRAGMMKELIRFERYKRIVDGYGDSNVDWVEDEELTRAQVTYNSGNRAEENHEIVNTYNVTFIVRLYHEVSENDRVIWKKKHYRILTINEDKDNQLKRIITELVTNE